MQSGLRVNFRRVNFEDAKAADFTIDRDPQKLTKVRTMIVMNVPSTFGFSPLNQVC